MDARGLGHVPAGIPLVRHRPGLHAGPKLSERGGTHAGHSFLRAKTLWRAVGRLERGALGGQRCAKRLGFYRQIRANTSNISPSSEVCELNR